MKEALKWLHRLCLHSCMVTLNTLPETQSPIRLLFFWTMYGIAHICRDWLPSHDSIQIYLHKSQKLCCIMIRLSYHAVDKVCIFKKVLKSDIS